MNEVRHFILMAGVNDVHGADIVHLRHLYRGLEAVAYRGNSGQMKHDVRLGFSHSLHYSFGVPNIADHLFIKLVKIISPIRHIPVETNDFVPLRY